MSLGWLLFSFKGRIPRLYFWITSLAVGAVVGILTWIVQFAANTYCMGEFDLETNEYEPTGLLAIVMSVVTLANIWINLALCVKRLHDRDRSGWWIGAVYLAILIAIGLGFLTLMQPEGQREPLNTVGVIVVMAATAFAFWILVEIGFFPGTQGPNRFGADPLGRRQPEAEFKTGA